MDRSNTTSIKNIEDIKDNKFTDGAAVHNNISDFIEK